MLNIEETSKKIKRVLEHIRPYLKIDGGDVEFLSVSEDGIVELRLLGSCNTCTLKPMTLRAGIERAIIYEIPEIKRIESK